MSVKIEQAYDLSGTGVCSYILCSKERLSAGLAWDRQAGLGFMLLDRQR